MNGPRDILRSVRRGLGLSPMRRVMRELRAHGVDPGKLDAIELFGGAGTFHTIDYARMVANLEVWEIDPGRANALQRNLPGAKISIVDSYRAVKNASKRYGLVVVDNPMSIEGGHVEHFDLFPDLFRLAEDRAIIILNVIPSVGADDLRKYPYLFNDAQCARRALFYGAPDPRSIPLPAMSETYSHLAAEAGFHTEWTFFQRRHFVYYMVMGISRG